MCCHVFSGDKTSPLEVVPASPVACEALTGYQNAAPGTYTMDCHVFSGVKRIDAVYGLCFPCRVVHVPTGCLKAAPGT